MGEAGILDHDDNVELLGGEIVQKAVIGPRHAAVVTRAHDALVAELGNSATVRVQSPVALDDLWEPEPDLAVCVRRNDYYATGHPRPSDVLLLVEVADSSLRRDRARKVARYGAAGVPEVWLIDLSAETLEVYQEPGSDGYESRTTHGPGETLTPVRLPDVSVETATFLA